jgi:hypothetical protein
MVPKILENSIPYCHVIIIYYLNYDGVELYILR